MARWAIMFFVGSALTPICAAAYSQLWLSYTPVSTQFRDALALSSIACHPGTSALYLSVCSELRVGLSSMLQQNLTADPGLGALVVSVDADSSTSPVWPPNPSLEGYTISRDANKTVTITAHAAHGALNGAWKLLRLVQLESPSLLSEGVVDVSAPGAPLRMWQLWDNFDGTIGRGNAGGSVVYPLAATDPSRVTDFARLLSSLGINSISWSNVNACHQGNEALLNATNIALLAPFVQTFYSYGIHSILVPC